MWQVQFIAIHRSQSVICATHMSGAYDTLAARGDILPLSASSTSVLEVRSDLKCIQRIMAGLVLQTV